MNKDNIKFYMDGCHLTIDVVDGTPDIYLVLLNTETKDYSEILQWQGTFEFDMEKDGIYKVCIIQSSMGTLSNGILTIGNEEYDSERFADVFASNVAAIGEDRFSEEIFCICNLKKCLLNLQMKAFQNALKNCGSRKCKDDEIKAQRDFLFMAVWLMEHLIEEGKEEKVREIYKSIQSCGSICNNLLGSNNCGCNE